ncbi:MAG TPA: TauD/TfdA family dioxygenase [Acidimicrobiia bacterium]|jgi:taurine dioxygenase|nr:TauD/TfdA family dioxygenase [Acidimicrobiia bacterium]
MPTVTRLDVTRLSPSLGAEVRGVDLASDLSDETVAEIRAIWLEHQVVFFPDQQLDPDSQVAFASRFGEVTEAHPVEPPMEGQTQVHAIDSLKDRTDFWHTDVTFMSKPPMASLLYAVTLPAVGGDTMWASLGNAYDTLATPLREFCDTLTAYHYDPYYAQIVENGGGQMWEGKRLEHLHPVEHPVVRVHPETGRKGLFVNSQFTVALKDFPKSQGDVLLRLLYDHTSRPENVCRYRWSEGTLGMWDNRATMHYGIYDYEGHRRVMHRVTLRGDRPTGVATSAR